jgi:hypothetical protein
MLHEVHQMLKASSFQVTDEQAEKSVIATNFHRMNELVDITPKSLHEAIDRNATQKNIISY